MDSLICRLSLSYKLSLLCELKELKLEFDLSALASASFFCSFIFWAASSSNFFFLAASSSSFFFLAASSTLFFSARALAALLSSFLVFLSSFLFLSASSSFYFFSSYSNSFCVAYYFASFSYFFLWFFSFLFLCFSVNPFSSISITLCYYDATSGFLAPVSTCFTSGLAGV